jgi:pilus assembly protein Flp/PilA
MPPNSDKPWSVSRGGAVALRNDAERANAQGINLPGSGQAGESRILAIVAEVWLALNGLKLTRAAPSPANAVRAGGQADPAFASNFVGAAGDIRMVGVFKNLAQDESGATAIEYGLIAALIAVAAIAAFRLVGSNLSKVFNTVATNL